MRQEYSTAILQQIADQYENLGEIKDTKLFTSGFENSNYLIATSVGRYVIKVFEGIGMTKENILFELQVMDHSYKSQVKTPHILKTKNSELYSNLEKKFAIVMEFIPGENLDHKTISDSLAYEIGQETGKLDKALAVFKDGSNTRQNYEWDIKTLLQLEQYVELLPANLNKQTIYNIFKDFKKIKPTFDGSPTGLIHNDVGLHNIMAENGKLTGILDFSDMAYSPYVQNIATSFAQAIFCYNWQPQQAKIYLDGYKEYINLSKQEIALLYDVTRARYATIIVEFNRWNVKYGTDQQRTEAIENFYKFLTNFESIGRGGILGQLEQG